MADGLSEADTCRKFVVPKLWRGWDNDPHSIAEQRTITEAGSSRSARASCASRPSGSTTCFAIRAIFRWPSSRRRRRTKSPATACSRPSSTPRCSASNSRTRPTATKSSNSITSTGHRDSTSPTYPTPDELWSRYRGGKRARTIEAGGAAAHAVQPRGRERRALLPANRDQPRPSRRSSRAQRRVLLTMATGTGKTAVAFQICWKLWSARWNRTGEYRRPRILYLADRNILVDHPKDGIFAAFGDARYKIEAGEVVKSREMYFAIYQALAEDERRAGLFREYPAGLFRSYHRRRMPPGQRARRELLARDPRVFRAGRINSA